MKINFAHNVFDRPKTLKETIEIERKYFPDCGVFVAYNSREFEKNIDSFNDLDVKFKYFQEPTHKIGCVNGAFHSISMAIETNPDIIIFSHDDVFISNKEMCEMNIKDIVSDKYDFIGRVPSNLPDIGKKYVMMEAMFFSLDAAKNIYKDFKPFNSEREIERDLRGSISPEVNMYYLIQSVNKKNLIEYIHENNPEVYNESLNKTIGFTHKNIGHRAWKE